MFVGAKSGYGTITFVPEEEIVGLKKLSLSFVETDLGGMLIIDVE